MPDRKYTYQVEIDAQQAQEAARRIREVFTREMTQALGGKSGGGGMVSEVAAAVKEQVAALKTEAAAAKQVESEKIAAEKQAAKERAQIAKGLAREKAAAEKQAAREAAEAAREAAYEEASIAKRAAQEVRATQKQLTQAFKQEQKEQVAAARQAAREVAAAERQAAQAQGAATGRGFSLGGTLRGIDQMLMFGVGGFAGYGAVQAGRQLYGMGREGAAQERTMLVLQQTAERMNISAQAMTRALTEGSKNTLSEAQAQQTALQLLSQKWAPTRTDIAGDAELIARAARIFSQRYSTSEGQAMSSSEVMGRLLGYIREGNKELIDQFGFNNAQVAKAAGVANENLTSEDRARGLFALLDEEVKRLGDTTGTSIDKIEQAEAQFTDAMDRIKRALAGPVANAAVFAADIVQNVTGTTANDLASTRATVKLLNQPTSQTRLEKMTGDTSRQTANEQYLDVLDKYDEALKRNAESAESYEAALNALGQAIIQNGGLTADQYTTLNQVATRLKLVTEGTDAYSVTMSKVTEEGVSQNTELLAIARAMAAYEEMLIAGQISMDEYTFGLGKLAEHLGVVATAAGVAAAGINAVTAATNAKPGTGFVRPDALGGGARTILRVDTPADARRAREIGGGNETGARTGVDPLTGSLTGRGSKGDRTRSGDPLDTLQGELNQYNERVAEEAQRDWESAAKKATNAFEQAAEDAAGAFKSALEKVPGLFGTSSVTEQDMKDAEAGVYQEKADEYLRQLRDEVLNKKDYPNVDLADIASVAGIDQSLSPEAQLRQIERMWEDSSLFANPEALRFVNQDAIRAAQAQEAASAQGKENLYAFLGLGPDSPLTPEQRKAYAEMTGAAPLPPSGMPAVDVPAMTKEGELPGLPNEDDVKAAAQTAAQVYAAEIAKPENTGATSDAFLAELLAGLDPSQIAGETAKTLQALGTSLFGAIYSGYSAAAGEAKWAAPIVDGLLDEVLPRVFAAIEEQT